MSFVLYDYWRSSASYRVRIALNLAGIAYDAVSVDLLAKDNKSPDHLDRNPQGFVPVLDIDGHRFTQSLAILDYLDQTRGLGLVSDNPVIAAHQRAAAHAIAVDIHPVCNVSVAAFAVSESGREETRQNWMTRFIAPGLAAFETLISPYSQANFAMSDTPSLVDICLMPQLYNADRWGVDYSGHMNITRVAEACSKLDAFQAAHPDRVKP